MKVVVVAYHNIGCTGIEALVAAGFSIQAVFTHEDDPEEERFFKSVKELCLTLKLPVFAPSNVNLPEWTDFVRQLKPEMLFSFFDRRILKGQILELGVKGAYNLHPSLLPLYRGCCPVNWVLINGETETGVTLHQMVERVDAGEILAQKAVPIDRQDTAKILHMKLDMATKSLLAYILPKIVKGETSPMPQDERISSYYGKRKPGDGVIHWEGSAERVFNLVRALTQPYPGAFTYIGQKKITVWEAAMTFRQGPSCPFPLCSKLAVAAGGWGFRQVQ